MEIWYVAIAVPYRLWIIFIFCLVWTPLQDTPGVRVKLQVFRGEHRTTHLAFDPSCVLSQRATWDNLGLCRCLPGCSHVALIWTSTHHSSMLHPPQWHCPYSHTSCVRSHTCLGARCPVRLKSRFQQSTVWCKENAVCNTECVGQRVK